MTHIRPMHVWLALMALTMVSFVFAEQVHIAHVAVVTIFVISAAKADLVIMQYMEASRALPHWPIMYRIWIAVMTLMLVTAHTIG